MDLCVHNAKQQSTISDGSFEQHLPLLEVWGVASQQKSGARSSVLWADHRLCQVGEQLQLLSESLRDHSVLLAQPLCKGKQPQNQTGLRNCNQGLFFQRLVLMQELRIHFNNLE